MKVYLETERLILRNLKTDDYLQAFKWCGDSKVNEYMIYPVYTNALDVKKWLESIDENDKDSYDIGIVLKETGELIGSGGLYYKPNRNAWALGYNLRADMWGQGYVPEAMKALIDYVQKTRGIEILEGEFCEENYKSQRVMEKLGMSYLEDSEYTKFDGSRVFKSKIFQKKYKHE